MTATLGGPAGAADASPAEAAGPVCAEAAIDAVKAKQCSSACKICLHWNQCSSFLPLSLAALRPSSAPNKPTLESRRHRQAKCLTRLAELILRAERLNRLHESVVSRAARREQVARDQLRRAALHLGAENHVVAERALEQTQRIVGVVDPERRIHHRHDHAK